jgi:hypothetical protein
MEVKALATALAVCCVIAFIPVTARDGAFFVAAQAKEAGQKNGAKQDKEVRGMKEFISPDGKFSVLMPGPKPPRASQRLSSAQERAERDHLHGSSC